MSLKIKETEKTSVAKVNKKFRLETASKLNKIIITYKSKHSLDKFP